MLTLSAPLFLKFMYPVNTHKTFHRIQIEYAPVLKPLTFPLVYRLLESGVRHNLTLQQVAANQVLPSLRAPLELQAWQVAQQANHWRKERQALKQQLNHLSQTNFKLYRSRCEADFAQLKLGDALFGKTTESLELVEFSLRNALLVEPDNYRAHFELGWLYGNLLNRLDYAEFHYGRAVSLTRRDHPQFYLFALRHLADIRYRQQRFTEATELALEIGDQTTLLEAHYELARYWAAIKEPEEALRVLHKVIETAPDYYVLAQVEPDFKPYDLIHGALLELREQRLDGIRHYVHKSWQNHPLSQLVLPDPLNANHLFKQVLQHHQRVMEYLPYSIISTRPQQIGDLVVRTSQRHLKRQVLDHVSMYDQQITKQQQRWSWINRLGGWLVHSAVVVLLAALLFMAIQLMLQLVGLGYLVTTPSYFNIVMGVVLVALFIGAMLIRYLPRKQKRALQKQYEFDKVLPLID